MDTRKISTSVAIITFSLGVGSAASAGIGDVLGTPTNPPPPPRVGTLVGPPPVRATTCEGADSCGLLSAACDFVGGTYSEWESPDHRHPHGICTWPWE
jgi:hypothetical protein